MAALAPILTWSSCPWLDGMLSTDEGVDSVLFKLTTEAAVYCVIMNPLFTPGFATRKLGSPRVPLTSLYMRRSEILANSHKAIARKSIGIAIGSPWKFPAEIIMSSSGHTVGLSVAEFTSTSTADVT